VSTPNPSPLASLSIAREIASKTARDYYVAEGGLPVDWDAWIDGKGRKWREEAHLSLLCDLSRPASRDAWVRALIAYLGEGWRIRVESSRDVPEDLHALILRVFAPKETPNAEPALS
jgi:hypothetical protein